MLLNFIIKDTHIKKLFYYLSIASLLISCGKDKELTKDDYSGNSGTFVDARDGNIYKWVKIGSQIWMAENLAYLPSFNSEKSIYYVMRYEGNDIDGAKSTNEYKKYGVFYNYYAANEACPNGWHLPSNAEWERLAEFISEDNGGLQKQEATNDDLEAWYEVGKQLKVVTNVYETNGTDNYGFSALLPGVGSTESVDFEGEYSCFWTATEENEGRAYARFVKSTTTLLYTTKYNKYRILNVRCLKN